MAELVHKHRFRKNEIDKQKRNRSGIIMGLFLVFVIIIVSITLWVYFTVRTYKGYEVLSELALNGTSYSFHNTKNTLMICNNDGAKAIDGDGKVLWEAGFQMENPELAHCDNVAAIADIGGKQVCVIAGNGIPHSYQVLYPIVKVTVAKQGVTAVLLDAGTDDYIQLYDIDGALRVDVNTKTKMHGFPVDIALSEDGTKFASLYLTFQGDSIVSKVTFYNVGEVGKNYQGNVVGQKIYDNEMISGIRFLDNNTMVVLQEKGFSLFQMKETPLLLYTKRFEERILDIICSDDAIVAITENSDTKSKKMTYYDTTGKEKACWNAIPEYETAYVANGEIILFSPQRVEIYRKNRTVKFEASFTRNLEAALFGGGNHYFLVDTGRIQVIKLSREQ